MAHELDSFLCKFKNLWNTGRHVKLTMEAKAGKADVTLCIRDLECPFLPPTKRSRNGPAQQRRRERRAKEREVAAEATNSKSTGEVAFEDKVVEAKEKTEENVTIEKVDSDRTLIIDLEKVNGRLVGVGADMVSPIPQMDGEAEMNESKDTLYQFISHYGEEDILYTLEELFPLKNFSLLSRVRLRTLDADHECTVALAATAGQSCIWPEMIGIQAQVCRELHRTN